MTAGRDPETGALPDGTPPPPPLTLLGKVRNLVAAVDAAAEYRDPLGAHIYRAGKYGFESAQLAGYLALASIAEDLHWFRELEEQAQAERKTIP